MNDHGINVSLCHDCLLADAGYDVHEVPGLSALALCHLQGYIIGPDCDIDDEEAYARHSDGYFSWGMCDGCGCTLGGTRWDMVAVPA